MWCKISGIENILFTVEVERINKKFSDINLEDIKMYHRECSGGKIDCRKISKGKLYPEDASKFFVSGDKGEDLRDEQGNYIEDYADYLEFFCSKCKKRLWAFKGIQALSAVKWATITGKADALSGDLEADWWGEVYDNYDPQMLCKKEEDRNMAYAIVVQRDANVVYCPYCSGKLVPSGSYCPFCGTNIEECLAEVKNPK